MNTLYIVGYVRLNFEFLAKVADMVVNGLPGIVVAVLMPYDVNNHLISKHTLRVHNQ